MPADADELPGRVRRRAAIMFIDVVNFSGSMEADEERTLGRWLKARTDLVEPQITNQNGRIIKSTGDGLLVEFKEAAAAVRCAIDIQRDIAAVNSGDRNARLLELRIAVHVTEFVADAEDIYGDGVNVAARLQEFADPGGVVVTAEVQAALGTSRWETQDLGSLRLKNMSRRVRAYRVVDPGTAIPPPQVRRRADLQPSLAVLPVRIRGGEPGDEDLVETALDEVARSLAGMSEFLVVARSSTAPFQYGTSDLAAVARQLGVRYLLVSQASRIKRKLLLTVDLLDTDAGHALWNVRHELPRRSLAPALYDIARSIVRTLAPNLRGAELRRVFAKPPESLDAYELVLKAAHLMHRLNHSELDQAKRMLDQAIEIDPTYNRAYSLLAEWHSLRIGQGLSANQQNEMAQLFHAVRTAVERNPVDAAALAIAGHLKAWLQKDYEGALELLDAARLISPNSVVAWTYSSPTYSYIGDPDQAIAHADFAIRLSPLDQHGYQMRAALALAHYSKGSFAECVRWARRAIAVNAAYAASHRFLCAGLAAQGQMDEAQAAAATLLALQPDFRVGPFAANYAFAEPARNQAFGHHLIQAGLPA